MKICDVTLKGEKVPIYLGSLYGMIDANNDWSSKLVINFYANIARRGYFASEYTEQLVKVLMMIPYRDTREVYWAYASERSNLKMLRLATSHNRDALQKFFMKTVLLINPDPNFIHTMFNIEIPEEVIKERFDRLLHEVQTISAEKAGKLTGQTLPVLVEEVNGQDASLVTGKLTNNSTVHFPGKADMIGTIQNVVLEECKGFYYIGRLA